MIEESYPLPFRCPLHLPFALAKKKTQAPNAAAISSWITSIAVFFLHLRCLPLAPKCMHVKTKASIRMGKKLEGSKKGSEGSKKETSRKEKEPQLPPPKCGETNQTAPPNQAKTWKRSTMKDTEIQELVDAKLLKEKAVVSWRSSYNNPWILEVHPRRR